MPLPPASELAAMELTQEAWMDLTATWKVYTQTADNYGGLKTVLTPTNDPLTGLTYIPIRLEETAIRSKLETDPAEVDLMVRQAAFRATVPARIHLKDHDTLSVSDGHTYEVLYVEDAPSFPITFTAGLSRVS